MSDPQADGNAADDRRGFLATACTWVGVSSLLTALASTLYANFRFFFPKVLYEPPFRVKVGFPQDYQADTVSDRWVKDHRIWIVREDDRLYALLAVCTHLGCITGFVSAERLFKCPCHGSNFSIAGDPLTGPAPLPLYRLALSLDDDGQIIVDRAVREGRPEERNRRPFFLEV